MLLLKKLGNFLLLSKSRREIVSPRKLLGRLIENIATGETQLETLVSWEGNIANVMTLICFLLHLQNKTKCSNNNNI